MTTDQDTSRNERRFRFYVGMVIGCAGLGILWLYAGWEVALGVYVTLWGHNIQRG